jgi:hypothetical protein
MGFGTPVGLYGVEGVQRIGSWFEISAGLGRGAAAMGAQLNPSPVHDLQWAVMPRLRLGDRKDALIFGGGLSGGNMGNGSAPSEGRDLPLTYTVWANFELGSEFWWDSGVALRLFFGVGISCSPQRCPTDTDRSIIPYLGSGLGYAF